MAASKYGSPGPCGSGSSRAESTEPEAEIRNWGRPHKSWARDGMQEMERERVWLLIYCASKC